MTHQKIEDYIGFNSDATVADRLHMPYSPSENGCYYCEYIIKLHPKKNRYPGSPYDGTNHVVINQVYCPFNLVEIDGVVYKRSRNPNPMDELKNGDMLNEYIDQRHLRRSRCLGCGVPIGFVHHAGCRNDRCPKHGGYLNLGSCLCSKRISYGIECQMTAITNHEDYIGFNSDATAADRLHIEYILSERGCHNCKYTVKIHVPVDDYCKYTARTHPDYAPTTQKTVINQVYCPFNRVRIDGVLYNRNRNPLVGMDFNIMQKTRLERMQKINATDREATLFNYRCHGCGVPFGFVHHVGCRHEQCPKCHCAMYRSSYIERKLFNCVDHVGSINEHCPKCIHLINRNVGHGICMCSKREYIIENDYVGV